MDNLQTLFDHLYQGKPLTREQMAQVFSTIIQGDMQPATMAGMLVALKMRGETIDEIAGAADALRQA
ncbi:MAG TPA: anthranilate phosphoribosyltransferase, partial [Shewanella frigidimarina]|nr:anthranilate phosphoribosyltransferase [Shewanella frigidimarina]